MQSWPHAAAAPPWSLLRARRSREDEDRGKLLPCASAPRRGGVLQCATVLPIIDAKWRAGPPTLWLALAPEGESWIRYMTCLRSSLLMLSTTLMSYPSELSMSAGRVSPSLPRVAWRTAAMAAAPVALRLPARRVSAAVEPLPAASMLPGVPGRARRRASAEAPGSWLSRHLTAA